MYLRLLCIYVTCVIKSLGHLCHLCRFATFTVTQLELLRHLSCYICSVVTPLQLLHLLYCYCTFEAQIALPYASYSTHEVGYSFTHAVTHLHSYFTQLRYLHYWLYRNVVIFSPSLRFENLVTIAVIGYDLIANSTPLSFWGFFHEEISYACFTNTW